MNKDSKEGLTLGTVVYKCDICNMTETDETKFMQHFKDYHSKQYIIGYECPWCGLAFRNAPTLRKHIIECLRGRDMLNNDKGRRYSQQEDILLRLINNVFKVIGKKKINKLTDFKRISREELTGERVDNVLSSMEDEFYEHFSKSDGGYYRKNLVDNYFLCALRGCVKSMGYTLQSKNHKITANGVAERKTFYTIIK
jgi:hypothetical protein